MFDSSTQAVPGEKRSERPTARRFPTPPNQSSKNRICVAFQKCASGTPRPSRTQNGESHAEITRPQDWTSSSRPCPPRPSVCRRPTATRRGDGLGLRLMALAGLMRRASPRPGELPTGMELTCRAPLSPGGERRRRARSSWRALRSLAVPGLGHSPAHTPRILRVAVIKQGVIKQEFPSGYCGQPSQLLDEYQATPDLGEGGGEGWCRKLTS